MSTKNAFKKKVVYKETYKRGVFETDRQKVSSWALDKDVWIEVINAGANEDNTEFVTVTFNNIKVKP
jgi:hypothetical protein